MTGLRESTRGEAGASAQRDVLVRTIETLERQRHVLGNEAIDVALAPLRAKLAGLDRQAVVAPLPERISERKVVTVLFADIAGFTAMSERIGSESSADIVNALFERLVPVIERYGGTIDKFIGDEIMAVFGAPHAAEHHVDHALRAALDMFVALSSFNHDRGLSLGLHVGVNSGAVVAGEVGSLARRDYSVTGDTVNVAARLEGVAQTGEIIVGPSTYRHAAAEFDFDALPALELKGKHRPLTPYRLIGMKPRRTQVANDRLELAFSGRGQELERLLARAAPDAATPRGTVGIVADPGVGKSRLLAELRDRVDPRLRFIEANAFDHRSDVSYGVVHELLDALVGRGHAADVEETAAAYGEFLDAMAGARAAEIRPYVFRLRGLGADEASDALLAGVAPAILRERMTSATAEIIAAATAGRPTIVRVEDLHWADASSVSLIRALAGHPALGHVLVLFTTRPDPGLAREWIEQLRSVDVPSVIELRPLPDAVIRDLLEHTLAGDDASPGLREQIRAKAQGNPFYLVSFLRSLLDDGIATLCAGRLHVTGNVVAMHVPETLHAAVGSRIDKLRPREKHVLRWGSVLGSTFSPAHVEALARAESGSGDVDLALSLLAERQLIEPEPDGRMRFVHAVVQDVAYEGMLERDRRRLHATVARLLGAEAAQTSEADIALLAWHHEHAGEREKASLRYAQASKLAANGFANREEIGYLESALRLADPQDIARTDALIERLGDVLQITGRFADAGARFEAIRAREQAETLDAVRVRRKLAKAWTSQQRFHETNAMIAEARGMLDRLRREPPDERWWREHFGVELFAMWAMYMQARNAELAELADRLAPEIEIHATLAERGLFHRSVALLELRQSRYRASLSTVAVAAQSADELRRAGNIAELGLANFGHAFALLWSGAVAEADERLQEVLRDTTRVGDAERNMLCLTYLAVTARMLHDVDRAEAFARAAISASLRNGSKHYEGVAYANLAWVAWRRGDGTAADEHVCTARRLCTLQGYPFDWLHGLVALARALERADDAAAAGEVRAMAADSQQLLRDGMQEALEATAADPTPETMKALLDVAIRAGYA